MSVYFREKAKARGINLGVISVRDSEKAMAPHSSVLAWKIPGMGVALIDYCLWGSTGSDTTEVT